MKGIRKMVLMNIIFLYAKKLQQKAHLYFVVLLSSSYINKENGTSGKVNVSAKLYSVPKKDD